MKQHQILQGGDLLSLQNKTLVVCFRIEILISISAIDTIMSKNCKYKTNL